MFVTFFSDFHTFLFCIYAFKTTWDANVLRTAASPKTAMVEAAVLHQALIFSPLKTFADISSL